MIYCTTRGLSGAGAHVHASDGATGGVKRPTFAEVAIFKRKRNVNHEERLVEKQRWSHFFNERKEEYELPKTKILIHLHIEVYMLIYYLLYYLVHVSRTFDRFPYFVHRVSLGIHSRFAKRTVFTF